MIFFIWHKKKLYISAIWVGTEKTDTFLERSIVADWYSLLLIPKLSFLDLLSNYLLPNMKSLSSIWRHDLPVSKEQDIWIVKQLAKIRLVFPLILNPSTTFSSPLPWFKSAAKSLPLLTNLRQLWKMLLHPSCGIFGTLANLRKRCLACEIAGGNRFKRFLKLNKNCIQ